MGVGRWWTYARTRQRVGEASRHGQEQCGLWRDPFKAIFEGNSKERLGDYKGSVEEFGLFKETRWAETESREGAATKTGIVVVRASYETQSDATTQPARSTVPLRNVPVPSSSPEIS